MKSGSGVTILRHYINGKQRSRYVITTRTCALRPKQGLFLTRARENAELVFGAAGIEPRPDLSGLHTTECLWCNHVALPVSVDCCRSVVVVRRGARCAGSQAAGSTLAWLRLPAGIRTAAQQYAAAVYAEGCDAAVRAAEQAPVVHRSDAALLRLGRRAALFRPPRFLPRPLQRRQFRTVLDPDADRRCLELR